MEYRVLGQTGVRVSALCLGSMQFGWTANEAESHEVLSAAFNAGINLIDTADIYSRWVDGNPGGVSEAIIGRWWRKEGIARHKLIIASKVRGPMGDDPNESGLSRRHIMWSIEKTLERLQTDYLDLYQLHWPDESTPIGETLRALDDLIHKGMVRFIGCSNYQAWQLVESLWRSDAGRLNAFVSLQPHYNLLHRDEYEDALEHVCLRYGLGVLPYSPLAGGVLTGKYTRRGKVDPESRLASSQKMQSYIDQDATWMLIEKLGEAAQSRKASISQVALGWLLQRESITSPIIGPRSLEQLEDNLGSIGLRLSDKELAEIDALTVDGPAA